MTNRDILLHRIVRVETSSDSKYEGTIEFHDEIGILFTPSDLNYNDCFIMWSNIKRIHIEKTRS